MARYKHPRNLGVDDPAQFAVDLDGEHVALDPDGCFESADEDAVETLARAHDVSVSELRVDETCEVVKNDGDVCGRDLPCRFHSE